MGQRHDHRPHAGPVRRGFGINDSGDIAGTFVGTWSAFLWRNGVFTGLGQLRPGGASPSAINNSAQIVGSSYMHNRARRGCRPHTRSSGRTA